MGVIPEKIDYKNCPKELFVKFADCICSRKLCEKVAYNAADEKSHFDRYGFVRNNKKVSLVYDNKARMISVTAFDDTIQLLSDAFAAVRREFEGGAKKEQKPQENQKNVFGKLPEKQNQKKLNDKQVKQNEKQANLTDKQVRNEKQVKQNDKQVKSVEKQTKSNDKQVTNERQGKPTDNQTKSADKQKKSVDAKTKSTDKNNNNNRNTQIENKQAQKAEIKKQNAQSEQAAKTEQDSAETGGDLSLKKYTAKRFDDVIEKLGKQKKKYKLTDEGITDKGKPTELKTFTVSGSGQKLKLRFMTKKQVLQLQGKRGSLFSELQILLSEETDYKAAVDAHNEIANETKKANEVERQLKKLIPNAYKYLSQQSKIDFTIGVIELVNSKAEHYDYSMLLLPPFRGLERLIFDLQRAQNIVVKMIGQAYEKEEGQYVLKASYRRKINSIVYAEVMAALYREYFETRNFYTHSESMEMAGTRLINNRDQALKIFTDMLKKVDYNCKKLSEIGFSI